MQTGPDAEAGAPQGPEACWTKAALGISAGFRYSEVLAKLRIFPADARWMQS